MTGGDRAGAQAGARARAGMAWHVQTDARRWAACGHIPHHTYTVVHRKKAYTHTNCWLHAWTCIANALRPASTPFNQCVHAPPASNPPPRGCHSFAPPPPLTSISDFPDVVEGPLALPPRTDASASKAAAEGALDGDADGAAELSAPCVSSPGSSAAMRTRSRLSRSTTDPSRSADTFIADLGLKELSANRTAPMNELRAADDAGSATGGPKPSVMVMEGAARGEGRPACPARAGGRPAGVAGATGAASWRPEGEAVNCWLRASAEESPLPLPAASAPSLAKDTASPSARPHSCWRWRAAGPAGWQVDPGSPMGRMQLSSHAAPVIRGQGAAASGGRPVRHPAPRPRSRAQGQGHRRLPAATV